MANTKKLHLNGQAAATFGIFGAALSRFSMSLPQVSVICLCHNHAPYVAASLASVLAQDWPNIQLVAVDDGSTDGSKALIRQFVERHPQTLFVDLPQQQGMCRAFNQGLALAKGGFVVDLAADDLLLPSRVSRQVDTFARLGESFGVVYTNAMLVTPAGQPLRTFYPEDKKKRTFHPPSGWLYSQLVGMNFICTPTMMSRMEVYEQLGGYDENLTYEDYDFWVRSGRLCQYHYLDEVLTHKRVVPGSASTYWLKPGFKGHLVSTLAVCRKALALNRDPADFASLAVSLRYHARLALFTHQFGLVPAFQELLAECAPLTFSDRLTALAAQKKTRLNRLYRLWLRLFRGTRV